MARELLRRGWDSTRERACFVLWWWKFLSWPMNYQRFVLVEVCSWIESLHRLPSDFISQGLFLQFDANAHYKILHQEKPPAVFQHYQRRWRWTKSIFPIKCSKTFRRKIAANENGMERKLVVMKITFFIISILKANFIPNDIEIEFFLTFLFSSSKWIL